MGISRRIAKNPAMVRRFDGLIPRLARPAPVGKDSGYRFPRWKAPRAGGMFALQNFFSVGANLRFAEKPPEFFAASGPALPATFFYAGHGL